MNFGYYFIISASIIILLLHTFGNWQLFIKYKIVNTINIQ